jgi:hypothetical protein
VHRRLPLRPRDDPGTPTRAVGRIPARVACALAALLALPAADVAATIGGTFYTTPYDYREFFAATDGGFTSPVDARSSNAPKPCCRRALPRSGRFPHWRRRAASGAVKRRGIAFATTRLAAGATARRDMIVDAWIDSANTSVGRPMVNVRDIESGKVRATRELFGAD